MTHRFVILSILIGAWRMTIGSDERETPDQESAPSLKFSPRNTTCKRLKRTPSADLSIVPSVSFGDMREDCETITDTQIESARTDPVTLRKNARQRRMLRRQQKAEAQERRSQMTRVKFMEERFLSEVQSLHSLPPRRNRQGGGCGCHCIFM